MEGRERRSNSKHVNGNPGEGPGSMRLPVPSWERGGNAEGAIAVLGISPAEVRGLTPETDGRLVCPTLRGARVRCERRSALGAQLDWYPAKSRAGT